MSSSPILSLNLHLQVGMIADRGSAKSFLGKLMALNTNISINIMNWKKLWYTQWCQIMGFDMMY